MKLEALGIPDEEEIIRARREKEEKLKMAAAAAAAGVFSMETFEQKYERELKRRADKKKKLEEDKQNREKEQYTFQPDLTRQRTKSPLDTGNRGSLLGPYARKTHATGNIVDFGTPDTLSINNQDVDTNNHIVNLKYQRHQQSSPPGNPQYEQSNKYKVYKTLGVSSSPAKHTTTNSQDFQRQQQHNFSQQKTALIEQSPGESNVMTVNAKERHNIGLSGMSKNGGGSGGAHPPLQGYLSSLKSSQGKSRTPQDTQIIELKFKKSIHEESSRGQREVSKDISSIAGVSDFEGRTATDEDMPGGNGNRGEEINFPQSSSKNIETILKVFSNIK